MVNTIALLTRTLTSRQTPTRPRSKSCSVAYILLPLLMLGASSIPQALAQDNRDVPFDTSNAPTREAVERLLELTGTLDDMGAKEKEDLLSYTHKSLVFNYMYSSMQTYYSCQTEIQDNCASAEKSEVNTCLFENHDNLGICCAANIRTMLGVRGTPEPIEYAGVVIPAGSELNFYDDCALGSIDLNETAEVDGLSVGPGAVQFNRNKGIESAMLTRGQIYKGLPIDNPSAFGTQFHPSGVPTKVLVAEDIDYLGIKLLAGSEVTYFENGQLASVSTSQTYTDKFGRQLNGKIEFHESGAVKSGSLAAPWNTPFAQLPTKTHARFSRAGNFDSVYIYHQHAMPSHPYLYGEFDTYPNGQLKRISLPNQSAIVIDGLAYPELTTLDFSENGRVLRDNFRNTEMSPTHPYVKSRPDWTLEETLQPISIGVWEFPARSALFKDSTGVIRKITPSAPIRYKQVELAVGSYEFNQQATSFFGAVLTRPINKMGLFLPSGTNVDMSINGIIRYANSDGRSTHHSNPIVPDSLIRMHSDGSIKRIELDKNSVIVGNTLERTAQIEYLKTGELHTLATDEPVELDNIWFDGDFIYFQSNGKVSSGILNFDTRLDNVLYAAGTELRFDNSGSVVHSWRRKVRWPGGQPPTINNQNIERADGMVVIVQGPQRAIRIPLYGPLSMEKCEETFGTSENPKKNVRYGFSGGMGNQMSAAALGCGTTDAQAGILERS